MAVSETARLLASLELENKFSKNASAAERSLDGLERKTSLLGKTGKEVGKGLGNAYNNVKLLAAAAAVGIGSQVALGIQSLSELAQVENQTQAVLKSTGGASGVSAQHIRTQAEELENLSTVDDKVIQAGENMLLTFKNIRNEAGKGNDIYDQATKTLLDMATAMGQDPKQAAIQLGKALNDPVKGITALTRVGVTFTEKQQDEIKALVKSGDTMKAQKIILRELNSEFGGSAAAFGKGPGAVMRRFADAVEGGQQALATGFLPLMERVSKKAQDLFSDPKVLAGIETFGSRAADALDDIIDIAEGLPWGAVGSAFNAMGTGARIAIDAFKAAPPWLQTAVLTGWGLNKLTGGSLGKIAIDLTTGGLKGLTGNLFQKGSSPANPLYVADVTGGLGGGGIDLPGGGGALAGGGKLAKLGKIGSKVLGYGGAILGGVSIGTEIGGELIRHEVEPAKNFEQSSFDKLLASNDPQAIQHGLDEINKTLQSSDPGTSAAIALSRLPFFNDAMGNLAGQLEDQKKALTAKLEEVRDSNRTTDSILMHNASEHNAVVRTSMQQNSQRVTSQIASHAASERGDLRRLQGETAGVRQASVRIPPHLARIAGADEQTARYTGIVSRKDFSPTVIAQISATVALSVNAAARSLTSRHIAVGAKGGLME